MATYYLSNFYSEVGADTEFKKIIATTCVSLMFQIYSGGLEVIKDNNGEYKHRKLRYDLCCGLIHGKYDKEVSLMLDLMSEVNYGGITITCSNPENNPFGDMMAKDLEIKRLEFLRDNKIPEMYLCPEEDLGYNNNPNLWKDTFEAAVQRRREKD